MWTNLKTPNVVTTDSDRVDDKEVIIMKTIEFPSLKHKLEEARKLICELCTKCGESVCKNGEECDWKESEGDGE